jgi:hypothetical protein
MRGNVYSDIQTSISELSDGINNALFAITGNAELIRLKISNGDQIDDHVSSILRLTQKIANFTTQLSTFTKPESSRD